MYFIHVFYTKLSQETQSKILKFSLETPSFSSKHKIFKYRGLKAFHQRPPIVHLRPQSCIKDPKLFIGGNIFSIQTQLTPKLFIGDPKLFLKNTGFLNVGLTFFIGDLQFLIFETTIFHRRPQTFIETPSFSGETQDF